MRSHFKSLKLVLVLVLVLVGCAHKEQPSIRSADGDQTSIDSGQKISSDLDFVEKVDRALRPYSQVTGTIRELASSQGNEVIAHFKDDTLVGVACNVYGETGRAEHYLYVRNHQPVALRRVEITYNKNLISGPGLEDSCNSVFLIRESQIDSCIDVRFATTGKCRPCAAQNIDMESLVRLIDKHFLDTLSYK